MNFVLIGAGLGKIKQNLTQYEVYNFLEIDDDSISVEGNRPKPELYEEAATPQIVRELLDGLDDTMTTAVAINVLEDVSGASLAILEQLTMQTNITEVFIYIPDLSYSQKIKTMQAKVAFGILQEYSRSGMLPPVFLIDAERCEKSLTGLTLKNKSSKVGEFIANLIHNFYFAMNSTKVENQTIENSETCVIGALGLLDFETGETFYTFPLKNFDGRYKFPLEANHYFFFTTETIENERITDKLNQLLEDRKPAYDTIGYSVIETEINQVVVVERTSKIQTLENHT